MTFRRALCRFAALTTVFAFGQSGSMAQVGQLRTGANSQATSRGQSTEPPVTPLRIFGTPVAYNSGSNDAGPVAVADVNEDGKVDVVLGNCCSGSTVGVLLGNGDGTLQAPTGYAVGTTQATSIAVADVNGDGHLDLVVATYYENGNPNSGGVAVLLGNGDGTFQTPVSYSSGGFYAIAVAIADVNGDGHPDLVAANQCQTSTGCGGYTQGSVAVLLGRGDGTFHAPVSYASASDTQWMAVADFNGDGIPDLVMAGETALVVSMGNGDGTFQPFIFYDAGGFPDSVAVADVNGDGKADIVLGVVCHNTCPTAAVSVLLGNGDGTFRAPILSDLPIDDDFSIAIKDLDGDGKPDVVLGSYFAQVAYSLLGNGDGTFQTAETYALGWKETNAVAIADLNGDGKPDLLATGNCSTRCTDPNFSLKVLLNTFDAATVGALTTSTNPIPVGQPATLTATFTSDPPLPDGEVIVFATGANLFLGNGTINSGVASLTTSFSKAGTFTVKAEYPGDLFHKAATLRVQQQVTLYSTTTVLSTTPNPSSIGQAVLLTAVVKTTGSATPTGTVTFKNGIGLLGTVALDSTGTATQTTTKLPVGSDSIIASYNGDSLNAKSASSPVIQTVNPAP